MNVKFRSLDDVATAVESAIPDALLRNIVITRVFIRTGINLREPQNGQKNDPAIVAEVARTFQELGYSLGKKS